MLASSILSNIREAWPADGPRLVEQSTITPAYETVPWPAHWLGRPCDDPPFRVCCDLSLFLEWAHEARYWELLAVRLARCALGLALVDLGYKVSYSPADDASSVPGNPINDEARATAARDYRATVSLQEDYSIMVFRYAVWKVPLTTP
jgi:hypothetical protein